MYEKTDPSLTPLIAKAEAVIAQLKKLSRNRQPGMDGSTVEHFRSVFMGGKGHNQLKQCQILEEYTLFLQNFFTAWRFHR